jgi:hypothetical protein
VRGQGSNSSFIGDITNYGYDFYSVGSITITSDKSVNLGNVDGRANNCVNVTPANISLTNCVAGNIYADATGQGCGYDAVNGGNVTLVGGSCGTINTSGQSAPCNYNGASLFGGIAGTVTLSAGIGGMPTHGTITSNKGGSCAGILGSGYTGSYYGANGLLDPSYSGEAYDEFGYIVCVRDGQADPGNYDCNIQCNGTAYSGCTNSSACNYDPNATCNDGSCTGQRGCTTYGACNYDPNATCNDGSCYWSCTESGARNYHDGCNSCWYTDCNVYNACNYDSNSFGTSECSWGCTDSGARNYHTDCNACWYTDCNVYNACNYDSNSFGTSECSWGCNNPTARNYHTDCNACWYTDCNVYNACNYDSNSFGTSECSWGCNNPTARNYHTDCNSCWYTDCADQNACNYDSNSFGYSDCTYPSDSCHDCSGNCICSDACGCNTETDNCKNCVTVGIGCYQSCLYGICGCSDDYGCGCNSDGSSIAPIDNCHNCDGSCGGVNGCVPDCLQNCGGSAYAGCTDSNACNYDPNASCDDGSCSGYYGCTNGAGCNYDPNASCDDGRCSGFSDCTDGSACNYHPNAPCDDGSCYWGCNNPSARNYHTDCNSCWYTDCADQNACNYDSNSFGSSECINYSDNCHDSCGNCICSDCGNGCGTEPDGCGNCVTIGTGYYGDCAGGFQGCTSASNDYFGNYCCDTDQSLDFFGNTLCSGYTGTCTDTANACGEDTTGCLYYACNGECTSRTQTLYPNCPQPSVQPSVLVSYKIGALPIPQNPNNPALKNVLLAQNMNFPLIIGTRTPLLGGNNPANAAEPNATAWVLMDGPWYNTPNVPSSGFIGGQSWRKMAPIGYAPYGRETYVYGDETVRYETGVWLYINSNLGEIARAYGEAAYPWLATWNNGFRGGKIISSYNKLENYPSYL